MTTTMQAVRVGLLAAVALTMGASPAQPAPQEAVPGNRLYLSVTRGDARAGHTRGTELICDPPQGHAHAAEACQELDAAKGDISRIRSKADVFCSLIYAPITASARGEWNGRPIDYTHTFSNSCVMGAETGAVFDLPE
jgi:hypothetical protein